MNPLQKPPARHTVRRTAGATSRGYKPVTTPAAQQVPIAGDVDETLDHLDVRPDDVVVDVGCGLGATTPRVSERHPSARVVGVDRSLFCCRGRRRVRRCRGSAVTRQLYRSSTVL